MTLSESLLPFSQLSTFHSQQGSICMFPVVKLGRERFSSSMESIDKEGRGQGYGSGGINEIF